MCGSLLFNMYCSAVGLIFINEKREKDCRASESLLVKYVLRKGKPSANEVTRNIRCTDTDCCNFDPSFTGTVSGTNRVSVGTLKEPFCWLSNIE